MDIAKTDIRLSVVVPFYNAERHIGDCVHSLMRQSLSGGIEFIFVNDRSTDASEAVLQAVVSSYPQRRDQVVVLRNDINRGSAYSRQRGVDAASGEFVIHCDADDWVDAEMYGTMLRVADSTGADVVCTPYYLEKGKGVVTRWVSLRSTIHSSTICLSTRFIAHCATRLYAAA